VRRSSHANANPYNTLNSWCGPCHALSPILKDATEALDGHVPTTGSGRALDLLTIDVENQSAGGYELSQEFKASPI
jgi:thiol-disulfide isomerase/thioredoxin